MHAVKRRCAVCHATYAQGESFCPIDGGAVVADTGPTTDELVGSTIDGRYLIIRMLGRGGMGKVYEADHVGLGKRVAIKFVSDADADRDQRARFRQEARAASRIAHENVIQIFDVGVDGNRDYLVMEYVEGRDLDAVLADGVLSASRAIAIAQQILRGLHACHSANIVHRDIKPSNIRLTNDQDFVKIMDFGISKSLRGHLAQTDTGTGRVIGTPEFMAPEQLVDGEVDHRADLFAVGATLFAMLAGAPPYAGFTGRQRAGTPPSIEELRGGLPPSLVAAIARALDPDPAKRFPDAMAFADALGDGAAVVEARAEAATKRASARVINRSSETALAPTKIADAPVAPSRRPWFLLAGVAIVAAAAVAITLLVTRGEKIQIVTVTPDASLPVDAAVVVTPDAAIVAAAPPDAAVKRTAPPRRPDPPAGTVIPVENKGKPCACEFTNAKGSIDRACTTLLKKPICECKKGSNSLCPFPVLVVEYGKIKPDGSKSGTMNCVDRTRPECDPTNKDMPSSCRMRERVAVDGAACSGYTSGMVEGDPKIEGAYSCSLCDPLPSNPRFYGKLGDQCIGYARSGEKVTGKLYCWD